MKKTTISCSMSGVPRRIEMKTCMNICSGLNLLILATAKRIPSGIENSRVKKKSSSVVPKPPIICRTIDKNIILPIASLL